MYRRIAILWMVIATIGTGCSRTNDTAFRVDDSLLPAVVGGNSEFAFKLYAKLADSQANLFFSPYSISTALAMSYAGAQGETQTEMRDVLRFPFEGEPLHACFGALLHRLTTGTPRKNGYQLLVANRLWGEEGPGFKFAEPFLKITRDYYFSELSKVSFSKDGAGACKLINDWTAEKTQNKICGLLKEGDVDERTILVLANAIYFRGDWASKFPERATSEAPFYLNATDSAPVPLMHQSHKFRCLATDAFQILQMPYKGDKLSMIVLLPGKRDGLKEIEQLLCASWLDQRLKALEQCQVEVLLPRFRLETSLSLKEMLSAMGMPKMFDEGRAEFNGMIERSASPSASSNISISAVIHKAYVDVNEQGTEAAAATRVSGAKSAPPRTVIFRADHPFVFLIRDDQSGSILFLGRFSSPGK